MLSGAGRSTWKGTCLDMMDSCTGIAYKRLHVQICPDNGSSDPPALFDDGIDASGGEVVLCDAGTLQGDVVRV